jgi:hypothetical protein
MCLQHVVAAFAASGGHRDNATKSTQNTGCWRHNDRFQLFTRDQSTTRWPGIIVGAGALVTTSNDDLLQVKAVNWRQQDPNIP